MVSFPPSVRAGCVLLGSSLAKGRKAWVAAQTQITSSQQPQQYSSIILLNPTNNKVKVLWQQIVELSTNEKN